MAFINSLVSYLALMIVIVILGAIAITLGITLRKRANAKAALEQGEDFEEDRQVEV